MTRSVTPGTPPGTTQNPPLPAPTPPPQHTRKTRGESAREWAGGEGRAPERDGIGATGTLPSPPSFLYSPRKRTKAANKSKTLSGLVTAQKNTNPIPLSANAPQHRFSGTFSTVVTVTVSTRPTSRPRRPYDRATLSVRETSKTPLNAPRPLNISVTSIKLLNNYSCSHLNYNKIAHTLQAFYAITAGQPTIKAHQGRQQHPDTPNISNQEREQGRRRRKRGGASREGEAKTPENQPKTT